MTMVANVIKDLSSYVAIISSSLPKTSGTIYVVARLELDGDADDGQFWDTNAGGSWEASPTTFPTATHAGNGIWTYALPAAATTGHGGGAVSWTMTDNEATPASATVISSFGEHRITVQDEVTTTDLDTACDTVTVTSMGTGVVTADAIAASAITSSELADGAITAAKFGAGAIDATAIATDAITNAKIAADAIGASELAADCITSSELATTAVNEIRDAILSDSTPFLGASIAAILTDTGTTLDTKINDIQGATFSSATDSLEAIRDRGDSAWLTGGGTGLTALASGTAQGGAAGSITLAAGASATDDLFNGARVLVGSGTGAGQSRIITDYNGTTKVASVAPNWTTSPDGTSVYELQASDSAVGWWRGAQPDALASGLVQADAIAISGDTTAADNLELQYDTTGLSGDTFPATQAQVGNLSVGSAAISTTAEPSPGGFVITTGQTEVNDEDSTAALDGTVHSIEDTAGTTDVYYIFDVGTNGVPVSVSWEGYAQANGSTWNFYAYNWAGAAWQQIGTRAGANGTTVVSQDFNLTTAHVGTGANIGLVHFRIESADGALFATDRITCAYSQVNESVGYANGSIWVDTANGTAGTELYVNGVADNPVSTWADALSISGSLGVEQFHISNGSTITLSGTSDNYTILGENWTLALGGQSIASTYVEGANVTGTGTGTGASFHGCVLDFGGGGDFTVANGTYHECGISGDLTLSAATTYDFHDCHSLIAGTGAPSIDFGAVVGNTNLNFRGYSGGIEIKNMGVTGTDTMSLEGNGQLIINSNCGAGATVAIRGNFTVTDNASGVVTLSDDARITRSEIVDDVLDEALSGHTTAGSLGKAVADVETDTATTIPGTITTLQSDVTTIDGIVDSILVDTGTTLPARFDTVDTNLATVDTVVDSVLVDTGTTLPATLTTIESKIDTVDTVVDALPSAATTADAVWDENIVSAHTTANTAGKKLNDTAGTVATNLDQVISDAVNNTAAAVWDDTLSGHLNAGSTGEALNNATAPTAAAVADAVWDEALSGHAAGGSAGAALAAAGAAGLTGAESVTITVDDGTNPLQGVRVAVYDSGNTVLQVAPNTIADGTATASLDGGTYKVRLLKSGYNFTTPETLTVSGTTTDTYSGTAVAVSSPVAPDGCVVYATILDASGTAVASQDITFTTIVPEILGGNQYSNTVITMTTDANGYAEQELSQGAIVRVQAEALGIDSRLTVPATASQDLTTWS